MHRFGKQDTKNIEYKMLQAKWSKNVLNANCFILLLTMSDIIYKILKTYSV